jgi:hypothetical protein
VRDENSRKLVHDALDCDPELVLDPCLLFPQPILRDAPTGGESFALVYGHGLPDWLGQAAQRWSRRTGIKLVSIGYRNDFADEQRIAAGPEEFADAVAGASAVITNFFHGCVFALANGKPFVSAPSAYRFNKVRDLAAALGAGHRLVGEGTANDTFDALLAEPVEHHVLAAIGELRAQSDRYLDAALA